MRDVASRRRARHAVTKPPRARDRNGDQSSLPGSRLGGEVPLNITVSELRRAANVLFDHLEGSGQSEIALTEDYYWNIPGDRLYAPEAPPKETLDLGQLTSDWEELLPVGRDHDPLPSHDLVQLAALLRFVGSKVLP